MSFAAQDRVQVTNASSPYRKQFGTVKTPASGTSHGLNEVTIDGMRSGAAAAILADRDLRGADRPNPFAPAEPMLTPSTYVSGQLQLIEAEVDADSAIEPGDLLFLDSGAARPASEMVWDTNLATTQTAFADVFLGIAHDRSKVGQDANISVDISPLSVYEFALDLSTYNMGNVLGPDEDSSSLMTQQLEAVAAASRAIARIVEPTSGVVGKALVTFASAFGTASANQNASVG